MSAGGVSACAVCDGFFFKGQDVAIVGAGDTAAEEATYLSKLCKKVYMIVRRGEMRASKAMQQRVKNTPNIEILWDSETLDILGKDTVEGAVVKNNKTNEMTINEARILISKQADKIKELEADYHDEFTKGILKTKEIEKLERIINFIQRGMEGNFRFESVINDLKGGIE